MGWVMGWVQHGKRVSPWTRRVLKSQVRGLPRALGRPSALPSKRCLVRGAQSLIRRPPCALARSQRSKVKAFGVRSGSSPLLLAFAPRLCSSPLLTRSGTVAVAKYISQSISPYYNSTRVLCKTLRAPRFRSITHSSTSYLVATLVATLPAYIPAPTPPLPGASSDEIYIHKKSIGRVYSRIISSHLIDTAIKR